MKIKKPTDDKLREQITKSNNYFIFFYVMVIVMLTFYLIKGNLDWLIGAIAFTVLMTSIKNHEYFDKIRLEIRELKQR